MLSVAGCPVAVTWAFCPEVNELLGLKARIGGSAVPDIMSMFAVVIEFADSGMVSLTATLPTSTSPMYESGMLKNALFEVTVFDTTGVSVFALSSEKL